MAVSLAFTNPQRAAGGVNALETGSGSDSVGAAWVLTGVPENAVPSTPWFSEPNGVPKICSTVW